MISSEEIAKKMKEIAPKVEANRVELLENIDKAALIWVHRHRLFDAVMKEAKLIDVSHGLGFQIVDRPSSRIVASVILVSRNPTAIGMGMTREEAQRRIEDKENIPCGFFHPCAATDEVYARALELEREREGDLVSFRRGEARGNILLSEVNGGE